jgi:hypothetical protein
MLFKDPALEFEYTKVAPELRLVADTLDLAIKARGYSPMVLTCLLRSSEGNAQMYLTLYKKLRDQGGASTDEQRKIMAEIKGMTDEQLLEKATARQSLHTIGRAFDMRSRNYTPEQKEVIKTKLKETAEKMGYLTGQYELLVHDITGPHIHFGLKPKQKVG